jgi:hypothetical protein
LPAINKPLPPPVRVDWKKADIELAAAVKAEALRIKDIDGTLVRVSITAIIKQVGRRAWFEKCLYKLPLTARIIKEHVETLAEFKIRRFYGRKNVIGGRVSILRGFNLRYEQD